MNKDLTIGKPETVLWRFCLPLFGSIIFQQLYNLADSLVAGKFAGENALAAVGNSYEITLIYIAFAFGCNMGCSVIVSSFFGAKEYSKMKTAVSTTMIASGILCGTLMVLGLALGEILLALIHTPAAIMRDSLQYLNIYTLGLPFLFFYNISTGIFSGLGDSKTPFAFLAFSSTANIAVDVLFVTVFQMGVAGVAWATFLCQGVSCLLALAVIDRRLKAVQTEEKPLLFSFPILGQIARIAIPSMLQQSFISVGNILLQSVINTFGPSVIAGYAASVKLNNLVITSFTTIGNGISNYTAQNLGAQKLDRIPSGWKAGLKLVWMLSVPLTLMYFFAGRWLMIPFMEHPDGLAMETGILYLRILSPFYWVVSAKLVTDGILRGSGMMNQFMTATFTDLVLRVGLAVCLSRTLLGCTGIWCAWPIGWSIATVMSGWFYLHGPWFDKKSSHQIEVGWASK